MKKLALKQSQKKGANQFLAAIAAGFLPVASYYLAHVEAPMKPYLFTLVAAALGYSAPTLAKWAESWTRNVWKAWAFTLLLEGVMVFSHCIALNLTGLAILVSINGVNAWAQAGKLCKVRA